MFKLKSYKINAFTLSEVLITLVIIGVVSSITITSLNNSIQDARIKARLKKIYSELSQTHKLLKMDYGGNYIEYCKKYDNACLMDIYTERINVLKTCNSSAPNACQSKSKYLNNKTNQSTIDINASLPSLITVSGYSIKFRVHDIYTSPQGWVQVDLNGLQKPNTAGKDIFFFNIYENDIGPFKHNDCKNGGAGMGCGKKYLK